ncbi:acetyltransferase, GNAT family [Purpureocillium lilacinum]|uniref:Acetyltransferase, GNAT family n=1 Tax=Purpureocillium lilacinum TaxID=33203 RepID=A0A179GPU7_PURLI|nr:acetyltransferase, GNAT family [Purpureocillium lilacinum]OAQ79390.1 acetyltransferase, GNAT family [Purpureocillium lilacinum]
MARTTRGAKSPVQQSISQTSSSPSSQIQSQSEAEPPPPLTYEVLTSDDAKRDALQLVADSIAQQRQVASLAVIFHPACFVAVVVACTLAWRHNAARDVGTAMTACSGLVIAFLAAVRLLTSRYVNIAEAFRWRDFIAPPAPGRAEDLVLGARFGEELIGALVLRLVPPADGDEGGRQADPSSSSTPSTRSKRKSAKNKKLQQGEKGGAPQAGGGGSGGLVRAWTTKLRYRGRGIGGDLLRFAVVTTRSACDDDSATVSFDPAHANSALPLPSMFNRPFRTRDDKARRALAHALRDCDSGDSSAFAFR